MEQSNSIELLRGTVSSLRRTQVRLCRRVESNPLHQLHRAASRRPAPPNNTPSPARRNVQQAEAYVDPHAVLYPSIRNLHDLWKEYIQGIGNNKPAREFTATERGKCKCKYSRRKIFWRLAAKLVDRGLSSDQVINQVYAAYGPKSPTTIINLIRKDTNDGTLPFQLR